MLGIIAWYNRTFGKRQYFIGDDNKAYIKEGGNPPEELSEHLGKYHLTDLEKLKEYGKMLDYCHSEARK